MLLHLLHAWPDLRKHALDLVPSGIQKIISHDLVILPGYGVTLTSRAVRCAQVMGVLDAMPSTNLKPEDDEEVLEEDRVYRTTYMFSATMPQVNQPSIHPHIAYHAVLPWHSFSSCDFPSMVVYHLGHTLQLRCC